MDVSAIAAASTTLADVGTSQSVSIAVLKKSQDIELSSATALIAAIPDSSTIQNLPEHLGKNINTTA